MFKQLSLLRKRYQKRISIVIGASIVLIFVLSSSFPTFLSFQVATAYSLSLILFYILLLLDLVEKHEEVTIFPNRDVTDDFLLNYASQNRVRTVRMIVYCRINRNQLEPLLFEKVDVYLLLQHPDHMVNDIERTSFRDFVNLVAKLLPEVVDISRLHISLFKERATHRAASFDNKLMMLSWYTYEYRKGSTGNVEEAIWGRRQPHIVVDSSSKSFAYCKEMFEREFNYLKNSASTQSLDDFLQEHSGYI